MSASGPTAPAGSRRWWVPVDDWKPEKVAYLYLSPALVFLGLTILYPLAYALYLAFHRMTFVGGIASFEWVGAKWFAALLSDSRLHNALLNTVTFSVVRVSLTILIGLAIALALANGVWGAEVFKRLFLIPWALSNVVNGLMWKWMYSGTHGIVNEVLVRLGLLSENVHWLANESTALGAVIFADTWKATPFVSLLLLAGLQSVPKELYEAARIDGAGAWRCFTSVTIPSIRQVLAVTLIIQTMWALRVHDIIVVLTAGGPLDKTQVLSLYAYEHAFRHFNLGYGSAVAWLITGLTFVVSLIYIQSLGREE